MSKIFQNGAFRKPSKDELRTYIREVIAARLPNQPLSSLDFLGMFSEVLNEIMFRHVENLEFVYYGASARTAVGVQLDQILYPFKRLDAAKASTNKIEIVLTEAAINTFESDGSFSLVFPQSLTLTTQDDQPKLYDLKSRGVTITTNQTHCLLYTSPSPRDS